MAKSHDKLSQQVVEASLGRKPLRHVKAVPMQGYPDRARKQGGGAALPLRVAPPTYPKNRDGQFSPPVPAKRFAERAGSMLASDASAAYTKDKRFAGWSTGEENSKWEKPSLGVLGWRLASRLLSYRSLVHINFVLKCRVLR